MRSESAIVELSEVSVQKIAKRFGVSRYVFLVLLFLVILAKVFMSILKTF